MIRVADVFMISYPSYSNSLVLILSPPLFFTYSNKDAASRKATEITTLPLMRMMFLKETM